SGSAPYSSATAAATRSSATSRLCPGSQPREQVGLRDRGAGLVDHPDEVLVAEGLLGDLGRDLAEPRVVDLAAVREQRRPLALEHRADVDRGGDPLLGLKRGAAPLLVLLPGGHRLTRR